MRFNSLAECRTALEDVETYLASLMDDDSPTSQFRYVEMAQVLGNLRRSLTWIRKIVNRPKISPGPVYPHSKK